MPGTLVINAEATFASALSMGVIPREVFGEAGVQERTKGSNIPKWTAGVAVSYNPDPVTGMTSPAEVLNITIVSAEDPGASCPPGTPVSFDSLRVGISAPEQRERKDGNGSRVVGGKPFYSCVALRPAQPANGRRFAEAKSE
jgi:hypothetical protein